MNPVNAGQPSHPQSSTKPFIPESLIDFRTVFSEKITDTFLAERTESVAFKDSVQLDGFLKSKGIPSDSMFAKSLRIDFTKEVGILVALPLQNDGGPDIRVSILDKMGSPTLRVQPIRVLPPLGKGASATYSRPVVYIAIGKSESIIKFESPIDLQE